MNRFVVNLLFVLGSAMVFAPWWILAFPPVPTIALGAAILVTAAVVNEP